MSNDLEPDGGPPEASARIDQWTDQRRRLLRGGLGAAPVVMTLAARPVIAAQCTAASSFTSLNASRPQQAYECIGRTPGYWKQSQWFSQWPQPYRPVASKYEPATKFNAVFNSTQGYPNKTLLEVLETGGNEYGRDALARHIVAALLNAAKGWTPSEVLSVGVVKEVWYEFDARGYYEPTAGVRWYADESNPQGRGGIIPWLKTTMMG